MADNVDLVSVTRPAFVRRPAFHVGILAVTASMSGCSSAWRRRLSDSGMPKYRQGKRDTAQGLDDLDCRIITADWRCDALFHIGGEPRGPGEELKDLSKAFEILSFR